MRKDLLTDSEIAGIQSCNVYWEEVSKRNDQSPLRNELRDLIDRLGCGRILFIVADYAKIQKEKMEEK